jgi:hypothetical protein
MRDALVRVALVLASMALLLPACGSGTPVGGSYIIDFPTLIDAVASDTVQVFVYAYPANTCESVVETFRTTSAAPTSFVAETQPVSPCALSSAGNALSVPLGEYAFLAVTVSGGKSLLVGCAAQTISDTNSVVDIPLTLASETVSVPMTTSCTTLSGFCAKSCM